MGEMNFYLNSLGFTNTSVIDTNNGHKHFNVTFDNKTVSFRFFGDSSGCQFAVNHQPGLNSSLDVHDGSSTRYDLKFRNNNLGKDLTNHLQTIKNKLLEFFKEKSG